MNKPTHEAAQAVGYRSRLVSVQIVPVVVGGKLTCAIAKRRPVNRFGNILESRLTAQSVALVVKKWALEDPAPLSGHSLRAGLATAAAKPARASDPS